MPGGIHIEINNQEGLKNMSQNLKTVEAIMIGAGQRGAQVYGAFAERNPKDIKFVAVAEPNAERREAFCRDHGIAAENAVEDWKELLARPKMADCVFVCTQDNEHIEPAMIAIDAGYHVVMEKPMSRNAAELRALQAKAEEKGRLVTVCHVLRYTPFFSKVRELLRSGVIGKLQSIQQIENVAYWHQAHSFVRGNWRREDETSPMILAKSCHDMDIMLWMADSHCTKVSSFGSLGHFNAENAPEGAPEYCLDGCPHADDCPYNAEHIYLQSKGVHVPVIRKVVSLEDTDESVREALRRGPYGRCVYHCDNNVVDHQVVNLEFENGVTASFTMTAFTWEGGRTIKVMGTHGQIVGDVESDFIEVTRFVNGEKTIIHMNADPEGHSGGDKGFMRDVVRQMQSDGAYTGRTQVSSSVESHLIALAAEESRVSGKTITLEDFEA